MSSDTKSVAPMVSRSSFVRELRKELTMPFGSSREPSSSPPPLPSREDGPPLSSLLNGVARSPVVAAA
jgi:hypothetical protein